jgi:transposase-like protein
MTSWIDQELAECTFGDMRLGKRFRVLMEQLSQAIGETIPDGVPRLGEYEGRLQVLFQ